MTEQADALEIHVNIQISPKTLRCIVENAKNTVGRNERGYYQVDTADVVSRLISRFLLEKDFASYVNDLSLYSS